MTSLVWAGPFLAVILNTILNYFFWVAAGVNFLPFILVLVKCKMIQVQNISIWTKVVSWRSSAIDHESSKNCDLRDKVYQNIGISNTQQAINNAWLHFLLFLPVLSLYWVSFCVDPIYLKNSLVINIIGQWYGMGWLHFLQNMQWHWQKAPFVSYCVYVE